MKINQYIYFIKKRLFATRMTILSVIVTSVAFCLLILSFVFPSVLKNGRTAINKCISGRMDNYAVSTMDSESLSKGGNELLKCMIDSPYIESFGNWNSVYKEFISAQKNDLEYIKLIYKEFNSNLKVYSERDNKIQCVTMPFSVYYYNNIEFYEEVDYTLVGKEKVAILGYNYKDIPIGTKLIDNRNIQYTVIGIMKKNQEIINAPSIEFNTGGFNFDYTINMNNMILLVDPEIKGRAIYSKSNFISFSKDISYEKGKKVLEDIFESQGASIKVSRLSDRIDEVMTRTDWFLNRFSASAFVFITLAIICVLSIQMMSFFSRKDEIGVWYSNGFLLKDIYKILFVENAIVIFVSYLISLGLYFMFFKYINLKYYTLITLSHILLIKGPLFLAIVGMMIIILISFISFTYIKKKSILQIINGNW